VPIEGHADNLAAALYGGVCFAMKRNGSIHAARIAADMPVGAILAVPATRMNTSQSRGGLPATVTHADAAHNAASAALLGAAIAGGDASLLRDAFDDRLHEQYRIADAPLLQQLRAHAPDGTVGVTLSGSGPPSSSGPIPRTPAMWRASSKLPSPTTPWCSRCGCPGRSPPHMSAYGQTHPAKRQSAALTDGVDRAPPARCSRVSASRTRTSRGR